MHRVAAYYIAFASGAAIMALEIIGLGILAPYFGTPLFVSANVIGVTLISLTIGYRLGGIWADTGLSTHLAKFVGSEEVIGALLLAASIWIGLIFPWSGVMSSIIGSYITTNTLASLIATIALFVVPNVLLGMVLPFLIKKQARSVATSGHESGALYGLSAVGSIAGTVVIGALILPHLQYVGALVTIVGLLVVGAFLTVMPKHYSIVVCLVSLACLVLIRPPDFIAHKDPLFADGKMLSDKSTWVKLADETSIFSRLQVYEGVEKFTERPVRFLVVNGEVHSGGYLDSNDLIFKYAQFNRLGGHFNPAAKHALLIGGGSYSYANYFLADTPLYDLEKVWKLEGEYYNNNKTVSVPLMLTNDSSRIGDEARLVYVASTTPLGRAAIEGTSNKISAANQHLHNYVVIKEVDIMDTGFPLANGYVHIHETKADGSPGRVISKNIPVGDPAMLRPRSIIGKGSLISGHNENVVVPLERDTPLQEGEVLYAMLHRDNGNGHFDSLLVDGYEQIESLDVVEIDPRTTALSAEYFHLNINDPRLQIFNEDGRTFINRNAPNYDIIYVDAFQSFYGIPWQLTTIEAVQRLHARLNDDGVVVVNVPSALEGPSSKLFQAELKTYLAIFPKVRAYAVSSAEALTKVQNIILVAFKNKDTIRTSPNDDKEINEQLAHEWRGSLDPSTEILTDDFAPTDYYTNIFADLHNF